jgi:hypothetical protein
MPLSALQLLLSLCRASGDLVNPFISEEYIQYQLTGLSFIVKFDAFSTYQKVLPPIRFLYDVMLVQAHKKKAMCH